MTPPRSTAPHDGPARPDRLRRGALALAALGLAALGMAAGPAAEGNAPRPLALFDGKTLDGWKPAGFANAGAVAVEDGALVMKAGRPMTGATCTRNDLPTVNYELSYEAERRAGNDFFAAATFPVGDAHITFVNGGWGGSVTGLSSLDGVDASENETNQYVKYRNGATYRFRVRVTATTIRAWVDDKEVVRVEHKGRQVGTRIETRACRPLGFATWESTGALRRVEVRRLTPDEVAATDAPAK